MNKSYIGRFAPSPTGPLHLGSLYTALASYLHAKAHHGQWLLRIDDLDVPRNVAGATEQIIDTLDRFHLYWDGNIHYQSNEPARYQTAITQLKSQQCIYPCCCTRKSLSTYNSPIYPGICRDNNSIPLSPHALRLFVPPGTIDFYDELQGGLSQSIAETSGDFIIARKDAVIAYQLAVTVDDQHQNITHIIRGCDLLDSTPKQIFIQQKLGYTTPQYCHLPVITNDQGEKLSKQTRAKAISSSNPEKTLLLLLSLLKQNPPNSLKHSSMQTILNWAIEHWQITPLKKIRAIYPEII